MCPSCPVLAVPCVLATARIAEAACGTGRPRGTQHARADHMESTRAAVEWEEGRHLERGIMSKVSLVQDLAREE